MLLTVEKVWAPRGGKNKDITAELNSQLPRLGKAITTVSNNDVVEYPDINQRQRTPDSLCNAFICSAGFRLTVGVVPAQKARGAYGRRPTLLNNWIT
jgi:hypothetical protein